MTSNFVTTIQLHFEKFCIIPFLSRNYNKKYSHANIIPYGIIHVNIHTEKSASQQNKILCNLPKMLLPHYTFCTRRINSEIFNEKRKKIHATLLLFWRKRAYKLNRTEMMSILQFEAGGRHFGKQHSCARHSTLKRLVSIQNFQKGTKCERRVFTPYWLGES